jgi:hypothetical protein
MVQQVFRKWFERWAMPLEIKLDNAIPWGGWYDLPTVFAMWLFGLGLEVCFNPPGRPQHNAVIERANGCAQKWAEVQKCHSVSELQEKLNESDEIQRAYMPSVKAVSRQQAYPGVEHSTRRYDAQWEEKNWDLAKVEEKLQTYVAKRKVVQSRISVYYRSIYTYAQWEGSEVEVSYDKASKGWVITRKQSNKIKRCPAVEINAEGIRELTAYAEAKEKTRKPTKKDPS